MRKALALLIPFAALAFQWVLREQFHGAVFVAFFPAIATAAYYGGRRMGLLSAGISVILLKLFFLKSFPNDGFRLLTFLTGGVLLSELMSRLQESRQHFKTLEERLRLALQAGQVHLWEFNPSANTVWRSEGLDRLFGLPESPTPFGLEQYLSQIHPEDRSRIEDSIRRAPGTDNPNFSIEFRVVWPDQSVHWLLSKGSISKNSSGKFAGLRGFTIDLTHIKQTEIALRDAIKSRDDFLSIASHELNTPLTSLQLQTQIRLRKLRKGDRSLCDVQELQSIFQADEGQIQRLVRLVDDMLDVSRIASGKFSIRPERFDLSLKIKEIVERLKPQLSQAGCEARMTSTGPVIGTWDRHRIAQVASNLVSNAMKYGPGRPIEIRVWRSGQSAFFSVTDHGIGIAPEDQQRIFERFERAASRSQASGLGLGLAIASEILEAHQGSITVKSQPAQGSTFTVEIPLDSTKEVSDSPDRAVGFELGS